MLIHDQLAPSQLDPLIAQCWLGLSSFGLSRKGMTEACTLKSGTISSPACLSMLAIATLRSLQISLSSAMDRQVVRHHRIRTCDADSAAPLLPLRPDP